MIIDPTPKHFFDDKKKPFNYEAHKKIVLRTRAIFSKYLNNPNAKDKREFGIDWKFLVFTLDTRNLRGKHIGHIFPLSYFEFIHPDNSIDLIEIKKAWSPANLKVESAIQNLTNSNKIEGRLFFFRFEFVFNDKKKVQSCYKFYRELGERNHKKIIELMSDPHFWD